MFLQQYLISMLAKEADDKVNLLYAIFQISVNFPELASFIEKLYRIDFLKQRVFITSDEFQHAMSCIRQKRLADLHANTFMDDEEKRLLKGKLESLLDFTEGLLKGYLKDKGLLIS